ncbi:unnamed protein product [Rotaria sordida]|uniref:Chlorophyllase n=1 Tax=Rotaria sordida TaxID=392033 RepID=A0A819H569_9BILA|nr:unnamed protein product [Rotaria sordida]
MRNNWTRLAIRTSMGLTILTLLLCISVMSPLNYVYYCFIDFLIATLVTISIITAAIYIFILVINFIWHRCFAISQQLSYGDVTLFIGSIITLPLFVYFIGNMESSPSLGLKLSIALSLSQAFFIGGILEGIFRRRKLFKAIYGVLAVMGCVGMIFILWYYLIDGFDMKIRVMIPLERLPQHIAEDPSLNGNYSYSFLTYGSGYDHRTDYGSKISIKTPTIDLSSFITSSSFNRKAFGYNETTVPLNGRIWYPTNIINSTSRFPIVMMVHGNHVSTESSEIGYDYLCKMLASQGFVCVSIDENFLNSPPDSSEIEYGKTSKIEQIDPDFISGLEMIARAIIILETLKQMRLWNTQTTNQFYNQLDLSNIGLMGHSRGGEAIAVAYVLNKFKFVPQYPTGISLIDYDFGIKALFSIAGTNYNYKFLGRSLELNDVSMFGIHGVYDGDVSSFVFQAKLGNLKFTPNSTNYNFKASLYVHQANHGQFNSIWGRYDLIPRPNKFMNLRPLISLEQQQHICKIYMSTFMNVVLKGQIQHRILFEDYRSALSYLPYTNYISTFQDSNEIIIADFENYDITVGTIVGSKINVTNLSLWSSVYVQVYQSGMLLLEPVKNLVGRYNIHLQNSLNGSVLRFGIGRPKDGLVDNLAVQILYDDGSSDSFITHVLPALSKQIFKHDQLKYVLAVQTVALPLKRPINGLEFVVNGTDAQFLIDNVVISH